MIRSSPFLVLLAASGLLHVAGVGSALVWFGQQDDVTTEKASIRVALGSRGAAAGQEVQPDVVPEDVPPHEEPPKPEPKPVPKPEPRKPVETVAVQEAERPVEPEPIQEAAETLPAVSALAGNAGKSGTQSDTQVDTEGDDAEAGYRALQASYDGLVLGHLARFKTFPPAARMRGEEGNVDVAFEIDRTGALVKCRLLSSSGSRRLDKAALEQIHEAVPFPVAPQDADWQARAYTTTMRYTLK